MNEQNPPRKNRRYTKNRTDMVLVYLGITVWGLLGLVAADWFVAEPAITIILACFSLAGLLLGAYQAVGAIDFRTAQLTSRQPKDER